MSAAGEELPAGDVAEVLRHGELEITGRLVEASNATLLCTATLDGVSTPCVYKPVRGERPLWDFPDGTLAGREVASYLISDATGWDVVPTTVLRSGPLGEGMVQRWVDTAAATISDVDDRDDGAGHGITVVEEELDGDDLVVLCPPREVPAGYRTVLRAQDWSGERVVLAHADDARLRRMAVLDVVLNNADRKGGHVLAALDGAVHGVDHGICLHAQHKLRTVLWGWAGEDVGDEAVEVLSRLAAQLHGALGDTLHEHLTVREVAAVERRVRRLLADRELPSPSGERPAIPWPAF
ncbi:SCO1664 family protein [Rhodococcus aerolatus]